MKEMKILAILNYGLETGYPQELQRHSPYRMLILVHLLIVIKEIPEFIRVQGARDLA